MAMLGLAEWSALAVSLILSARGVGRRDGILLILAGVLSLGFCLIAVLSIGPLVSIVPFLQLALGAGYLVRASRRGMWALGGAALVLYGAVLARVFLSMHGA
ncbi:MAG: hypothetical protein K6U89_05555 [Chloroflexi bacterium]|nr:hypothetical protein [Chloroflexota bacterium]